MTRPDRLTTEQIEVGFRTLIPKADSEDKPEIHTCTARRDVQAPETSRNSQLFTLTVSCLPAKCIDQKLVTYPTI